MSNQSAKFVLIGPHKGKTMEVNGRPFEEGHYTFEGSKTEVENLTRLFSYYGAVPEADAALMDAIDGNDGNDGNDGGSVGSTDKAPAAPVLDPKPTLAEALGDLDPDNEDHWTSNNLPSLDFLSEKTGTKVSRAQVEEVADGFTRAKAKALKD